MTTMRSFFNLNIKAAAAIESKKKELGNDEAKAGKVDDYNQH
jgi:hypothetical protein